MVVQHGVCHVGAAAGQVAQQACGNDRVRHHVAPLLGREWRLADQDGGFDVELADVVHEARHQRWRQRCGGVHGEQQGAGNQAHAHGVGQLVRAAVGIHGEQRVQLRAEVQLPKALQHVGGLLGAAQAGEQGVLVHEAVGDGVHRSGGDAGHDARAGFQWLEQLVLQQPVAHAGIDGGALGHQLHARAADDVFRGLDAPGLAGLDEVVEIVLIHRESVAHGLISLNRLTGKRPDRAAGAIIIKRVREWECRADSAGSLA